MTYRANMYQHINYAHVIDKDKKKKYTETPDTNVSIQEENVPLEINSLGEKLENHKEDQSSLVKGNQEGGHIRNKHSNEKESVTIVDSDPSQAQNQMAITNKEIENEKEKEKSLDREISSSSSSECEPMIKLSSKKELINSERKCQYCKIIFFAGYGNNQACKLCLDKLKTDIYGQMRKEHSKEKENVTNFVSDSSKTQNQNISTRLQFYEKIIEKRKNQESKEESKTRKQYEKCISDVQSFIDQQKNVDKNLSTVSVLEKKQKMSKQELPTIEYVDDEDQEILGL